MESFTPFNTKLKADLFKLLSTFQLLNKLLKERELRQSPKNQKSLNSLTRKELSPVPTNSEPPS